VECDICNAVGFGTIKLRALNEENTNGKECTWKVKVLP